MSNQNGRLPRSDLMEVEKGTLLAKPSARAYRRAKAYFYDQGANLRLVDTSAGYRTIAVQKAMHDASVSNDPKLKAKWNLDPNSSVPLAQPGYSSHGMGDRCDLLVNGHTPSAADRAALAIFGFTREFGAADPNHFQHKGSAGTAPASRAFCLQHHLFVQPA